MNEIGNLKLSDELALRIFDLDQNFIEYLESCKNGLYNTNLNELIEELSKILKDLDMSTEIAMEVEDYILNHKVGKFLEDNNDLGDLLKNSMKNYEIKKAAEKIFKFIDKYNETNKLCEYYKTKYEHEKAKLKVLLS